MAELVFSSLGLSLSSITVILDLQKVYKLQFCRLTHPFTKFALHKTSLLLDLLLNLRSNDGDSRP